MDTSSLLLGRYKIVEALGEGGFSKVFKAFDTKMERTVAVKMIPAGKKTGVRALREAKTVALLNHSNIVTLYEFEEKDDSYYLIMEYVEGQELAALLQTFKRLPGELAAAIGIAVCDALECAHANDVIHRDIKPANIRVLKDGRVKVMDFGIARLLSAAKTSGLTADGEIVGTFAYMSPEQSSGEVVDERSDIFSLGVLLYESVTGTLPFIADTPAATIYKTLNEDPTPPREIAPSVSAGLNKIILAALAKSPQDRPQTVVDLKNKLEEARQEVAAPAEVVKDMVGKLRAPRSPRGAGVLGNTRSRLGYWVKEYEDTATVTGYAAGCTIVSIWSGFYFPIIETGLNIFLPIIIFFTALFVPPAGLAAALGLLSAGLWFESMYLGATVAILSAIYWITLGRSFPQFAILPLLAPALAWLKLPFLLPLAAGIVFGPVLAAFVAGFGALVLASAEVLGRQAYAWTISSQPELIYLSSLQNELNDLVKLGDYFVNQPWLLAQAGIWSGVALIVSLIKSFRTNLSHWAAAIIGVIALFLGYRLTASALEIDYAFDGMVTEPAIFSIALLLIYMFFFYDPDRDSS